MYGFTLTVEVDPDVLRLPEVDGATLDIVRAVTLIVCPKCDTPSRVKRIAYFANGVVTATRTCGCTYAANSGPTGS